MTTLFQSPLSQSSGDLIADRRYALGQDYAQRGDHAAAADLFTQAIEAAPAFASAWFALGETQERLGAFPAAVAAFRKSRELDPRDSHGAGVRLMRLKAEAIGDMPRDYVRTLYDQYAPRFEDALTNKLSYRGPELLRDAITRACAAAERRLYFSSMLDIGCGTGLGGVAFRPLTGGLAGIDLSPRMIERARAKRIYETLSIGDITEFLKAEKSSTRHQLVLAADVFIYLADLAAVIADCGAVLEDRGMLAFTVETHAEEGIVLGEKLRYAHGMPHVRKALDAAGLVPLLIEATSIRNEGGVAVPGLVVVAMKSLTCKPEPGGGACR